MRWICSNRWCASVPSHLACPSHLSCGTTICRAPVHPATATLRDDWRYYPTPPAPLAPGGAPVYDEPPRARGWGLGLGTPAGQPSGARLKIMRCAQLYADSSAFGGQDGGTSGSDGDGGGATLFQDGKPRRPLLDFGVGASLNLDTQVRSAAGWSMWWRAAPLITITLREHLPGICVHCSHDPLGCWLGLAVVSV
jgi:hypothetical protein